MDPTTLALLALFGGLALIVVVLPMLAGRLVRQPLPSGAVVRPPAYRDLREPDEVRPKEGVNMPASAAKIADARAAFGRRRAQAMRARHGQAAGPDPLATYDHSPSAAAIHAAFNPDDLPAA